MNRIVLLCTFLLFFITAGSVAQVSVGDKGTLSGSVFTDYYWMAQHHNNDIQDQNGFWFRRIYLTYDHELSDKFSSRIRFEADSPGDFESDSEMIPNVKDAYLKWQDDRHQILAGISPTPTWELVEKVWGYRTVEKVPLDLFGFGSSRDFGLSFKGDLIKTGKVKYHFFLGNGNGIRPEIDTGKKFMLSLAYNITDHLVVEGYADWNDSSTGLDSYTAHFMAGYRSDKFNVGALAAYNDSGSLNGIEEVSLDLVSLFANAAFNEKTKVFMRADHLFEPYPGGSENSYIPFAEEAESTTFMVGGIDYLIEDKIHLIPNVEAVVYGENIFGISPDTDIIPRLTLSYAF